MVRILSALFFPSFLVRLIMTKARRVLISKAISKAEIGNHSEIQVVVEATLPLLFVLTGGTPRKRAEQYFLSKGMTQTSHRSGILIYVYLAEKIVEVVCDEGVPVEELSLSDILEKAKQGNSYRASLTNIGKRLVHFLEDLLFHFGESLRASKLQLAAGEKKRNELSDDI